MAVSDDFVNYVLDQLSGWGKVTVRRMFGGAGLYREGRIFGVIAGNVAYLKVDHSTRGEFVKAGAAPFNSYPDKMKTNVSSYYEIPPEVLDHPQQLALWAQRAWEIARKG
jgi:DNA transformation protein